MQLNKFPTRADLCEKPEQLNTRDLLKIPKVSFWFRKPHQLTTTCEMHSSSSDHAILYTNKLKYFFQCMLKNIQDVTKPASTYFLQIILGDPIQSVIKDAYICVCTCFLYVDIFIAVTSRCSAFPHLYREHCCLHLDADLQVNGNTRQGVANEKLEYDSYLKRLTFLLLCHCTL